MQRLPADFYLAKIDLRLPDRLELCIFAAGQASPILLGLQPWLLDIRRHVFLAILDVGRLCLEWGPNEKQEAGLQVLMGGGMEGWT